jgi:hypothetical protein
MLNRKQIEDISDNSISWTLKDLAQTALTAIDMLKRLEWVELGEREGEEEMIPAIICPSCDNWKEEEHNPDCELAKLLKEVSP